MEWDIRRTQLAKTLSFDVSVYRELRHDPRATLPALAVPILAMFGFGLGGFLWFVVEMEGSWEFFWKSAIVGSLLGLVFWFVWMGVVYLLLGHVDGERMEPSEFGRVMAPASAPLLLGFFMFIPEINFGVGLVAVGLLFTSCVLAAQHGLGASPQKAVWANLAGFAIWAAVLPMIVTTENPFAPGIFVFDWTGDIMVNIYNAFKQISEEFGGGIGQFEQFIGE